MAGETESNKSFFDLSRIKFTELYNDAINYLSAKFNQNSQRFSLASAFGQLLQVVMNLGRMILYYIEDSITELNIYTATRPNSIKGLAVLTGHNPSRAIAARGSLKLSYNGQSYSDIMGNVAIIPNYAEVQSTLNGLVYTLLLPTDELRLNLENTNNNVEVNVVQGQYEYQQVTGDGMSLQSYNIAVKSGTELDNFLVNVYVNGKLWDNVSSILDMSYDQEAVIVKTGINGGIDIFFGNGYNGKIPELNSNILVQYLITSGENGNIDSIDANELGSWQFITNGYDIGGNSIDLNNYLDIVLEHDIIMGTAPETLYQTRMLAPNLSRSFVLANEKNYQYFLKKLNMFSVVEAIPGFKTYLDVNLREKMETAHNNYLESSNNYTLAVNRYGDTSSEVLEAKTIMEKYRNEYNYYSKLVNEETFDDNTVYLFLVPDLNKRISSNYNYFSAPFESFVLNDEEKEAILNLIEESGERILTVDNVIVEPKYVNFATNISILPFSNYNQNNIRETVISELSQYFITNTRRDLIPVSDLIRIIEDIDGVDSVTVNFDADVNNMNVYGNSYGIDDYGDIVLNRSVDTLSGERLNIKDIQPLFRGGFTSPNGVVYAEGLPDSYTKNNSLFALNITFRNNG